MAAILSRPQCVKHLHRVISTLWYLKCLLFTSHSPILCPQNSIFTMGKITLKFRHFHLTKCLWKILSAMVLQSWRRQNSFWVHIKPVTDHETPSQVLNSTMLKLTLSSKKYLVELNIPLYTYALCIQVKHDQLVSLWKSVTFHGKLFQIIWMIYNKIIIWITGLKHNLLVHTSGLTMAH